MRSPRYWRKIIGWLGDLVALSVAWIITGYAVWDHNDQMAGIFLLFTIAIIPALNAIWLQIRVAPRIYQLARQLSSKDIPGECAINGKWIIKALKKPMLRALAPVMTTLPVQTVVLVMRARWQWEQLLGVIFILGAIFAGFMLAVAGIFDLLVRLLRAKKGRIALCITVPLIWTLIAICLPGGLPGLLFMFITGVMQANEYIGITLSGVLMLILFLASLAILQRRNRRASAEIKLAEEFLHA